MPFNPNLPIADSELDAGQMRNQFNGLKTFIDNVPAGPPGPEGPPWDATLLTWLGDEYARLVRRERRGLRSLMP